MPRRNITLTDHFAAFLDTYVQSGRYRTPSEVVSEALRLLEQAKREDELRLERLRQASEAGFAAIDRGEFAEISDDEIGPAIARIGKRIVDRARSRAE